MLLLLMSTGIYVVRTLAFWQEKCAKTKSTAWPWKCSSKIHPQPLPLPMHSGFPSFISRLVIIAENWTVPSWSFPSWSASFCCYQGLQICHRSSPHLKHGIISEVEVEALETSFSSANFLQIQDLGSQLLGCTLWAFARFVVQPVVVFWNPFHPGRWCFIVPLGFRMYQVCRWVCVAGYQSATPRLLELS